MSEIFELMHQAREVAETAKDAMGHSVAADKTTQRLSRTILEEAKRLLPNNRVVQSLDLPAAEDVPWESVRSAMTACYEALLQANTARARSAQQRGGGPWR